VQGHQVVCKLWKVIGPGTRQEQVSLGKPRPPLINVDAYAQAVSSPNR